MIAISSKRFLLLCSLAAALFLFNACNSDTELTDPVLPEGFNSGDNAMDRGYVYACNKTGNFEIWKSEGNTHQQLTTEPSSDLWWPRYCRATDRILFYKSISGRDINDFTNAELWVMDADGSNQKKILSSGAYGWEKQGLADWSPDGQHIIMSAVDPEIGTWQLYKTDNEGLNVERISMRNDAHHLDPIFSPSGDAIFYVSSPETSPNTDEYFEIFRLSLNEMVEERLTYNNRPDHHPYPSDDGTKIIFETLIEPDYLALGKWAIHELELASSTEKIILDDDNINLFPRYSIDGSRVYFSCLNIETFGMKIASFDLNTSEKTYLVDEYYNALNVDPF